MKRAMISVKDGIGGMKGQRGEGDWPNIKKDMFSAPKAPKILDK